MSGTEGTEALESPRRRLAGPFLALLQWMRLATNLVWLALLIPFAMDITFPEGSVVSRAYEAARGQPVYQDWREWPHIIAPYGPLTYYSGGGLARVFGGESPSPRLVYRVGRAQSFLAVVGCCALIVAMLRRRKIGIGWSLVAAALFLSWERPATFSVSYRPDAPQVFFALLALWIADGGPPRARRVVAALVALSASMWFKPMSFGILIALAFWLRPLGWKRAAAIVAAFGGVNLAAAVAMNVATDGRLFLNMITALDNGLAPGNFRNVYLNMPPATLAMLAAGMGCAAVSVVRAARARAPLPLLDLAAVASFAVSNLQELKFGADANYFLEMLALASVAAVARLAPLWRGELEMRAPVREALLWLVVVPLALADSVQGLKSIRADLRGAGKMARGTTNKEQAVAHVNGPILTIEPFLAMCRPSPPTPMDLPHYQNMVERGHLDPSILAGKLERREFKLVILSVNDIDPATGLRWMDASVRDAIYRNYPLRETIANVVFMRPDLSDR